MTQSALIAILDSMIINSLLRSPRPRKRSARKCSTHLDEYVMNRSLRFAMDSLGSLEPEWVACAGLEFVRQLIVFWQGFDGIKEVRDLGRIPHGISRRLRVMGLVGTVDRLLVKIALGVNGDKRLVSNDSDFWDPAASNPRSCLGDRNACVAKCLRERLGVEVRTLPQLLQEMRS